VHDGRLMKKQAQVKLRLASETVRTLQEHELRDAAGGMSVWYKCSRSCMMNCDSMSCEDGCPTLGCP
jgi:hypothetical protein